MITDDQIDQIEQWAQTVIDDHPTRCLVAVALGHRAPILSGYYETGTRVQARRVIEDSIAAGALIEVRS